MPSHGPSKKRNLDRDVSESPAKQRATVRNLDGEEISDEEIQIVNDTSLESESSASATISRVVSSAAAAISAAASSANAAIGASTSASAASSSSAAAVDLTREDPVDLTDENGQVICLPVTESSGDADECSICLEKGVLAPGSPILACGTCKKVLHLQCAMKLKDPRCPNCRAKLFDEAPGAPRGYGRYGSGRIHDMMKRKHIITDKIKLVVLDEADEMLSSGFKEQMYKIFQYLNDDIQIGLFSATMPNELKELTKTFLQNPVKILVKPDMLTLEGISQFYINIQNDIEKYETIKDIFEAVSVSQSIIYCNSVRRVDDLTEAMKGDNFPVEKMHGKMTEQERKETFKLFKQGHCRVLITSDLFARGIDIQQVSIVINFDIPKNEYTYLHRIGRSGRWGRKGIAINFQTKYDISKLKYFEKYYNTEIVEMPLNFHELIAS